jgi:hypothetical protein
MRPKDDQTSLGNILVNMGLVSQDQLAEAVLEQQQTSIEVLMGKLLVADGVISEEQLQRALEIQQGLRSKHKYDRALAMSEVATFTHTRVVELASVAKSKVAEIRNECVAKRRADRHR